MKLKTTYTPYNSSWLKFGGCLLLGGVARSLNPKIAQLLMIGYFAHNLYEQYQHNNNLTKTIKLKLEGEKETRIVEMKPNFNDIFNQYNVSGLLFACLVSTLQIIEFFVPQQYLKKAKPIIIPITVGTIVSKAIHLFSSDESEYTFTDKETGALFNEQDIIDSDFLGYIN